MPASESLCPVFDLYCWLRAIQTFTSQFYKYQQNLSFLPVLWCPFSKILPSNTSLCFSNTPSILPSPFVGSLFPYFSLPDIQKQHCCVRGVCLQSQCHITGFQRALQVPGELALSVAALPQPQPRLSGNKITQTFHKIFFFLSFGDTTNTEARQRGYSLASGSVRWCSANANM